MGGQGIRGTAHSEVGGVLATFLTWVCLCGRAFFNLFLKPYLQVLCILPYDKIHMEYWIASG